MHVFFVLHYLKSIFHYQLKYLAIKGLGNTFIFIFNLESWRLSCLHIHHKCRFDIALNGNYFSISLKMCIFTINIEERIGLLRYKCNIMKKIFISSITFFRHTFQALIEYTIHYIDII